MFESDVEKVSNAKTVHHLSVNFTVGMRIPLRFSAGPLKCARRKSSSAWLTLVGGAENP